MGASRAVIVLAAFAVLIAGVARADEKPAVVANVKVLSDKVKDVSSLEAWKKSYITDGMTDRQKAMAIWECMVGHQHQDAPPMEFLNNENTVQDAVKMMNVYGYSFCGVVANEITSLARYVGLEARISTINAHVVPELKWDGKWHLLDASLINYFPKPDGDLASIDEIMAAVKEFYDANPDFLIPPKDGKGKPKADDAKLRKFHQADNWQGWKKGPALLANSPMYSDSGWLAAKTHGWYATMGEYDGSVYFPYEAGYSMGYAVNIQLRPGERLTRNWSNKGLHINSVGGGNAPGCMNMKVGEGNLAYTPKFGDKAPGRVGNGLREYDVPLADVSVERTAAKYENLAVSAKGTPVLQTRQGDKPGVLEIMMPSSYPALSGLIDINAVLGEGGTVEVSFSDNNGLDFKPIATIAKAGPQTLDFGKLVFRRYDYRLRLVMTGAGTGVNSLKIRNDIQHSQRPLPALEAGENTITFSAGPQEGVVTIEGACNPSVNKGLNLTWKDFHPEVKSLKEDGLMVTGETGEIVHHVQAAGDITSMSIMTHYRARGAKSGWNVQVSYDEGKTYKDVASCVGPVVAGGVFTEIRDVPAGTRTVYVKHAGFGGSAGVMLFNQRIDARYKLPGAGFRPVKVTYVWEENGLEKTDSHTAKAREETWKIRCEGKPLMKSIVLELAE